MNFDYDEEQQLLADSVRRFIRRDYDFESRKKIVASAEGWSEKAWGTFAEMGLLGLPFSPDYGGFGGGAVDLMSVMEMFGEALVVEPYLATVGLGAQFVARAGTAAQKNRILPQVVEGKLKMAFAQTEKDARYNLAQVAATARKAGSSPVTWRTVRPSTATVSSWRAERSAWITSRMRERAAMGERKVSISSSDATMAWPR